MKNRILFCAVLFYASSAVLAGDGSPLTSRGVGAFSSFAGSWSAGMGNSGLALSGDGVLNGLNPATWVGLENAQFSGAYDFSGVNSRDNTNGLTSYYANGNFGGGIFALPIGRSLGISLAAGFTPYTSYEFKINTPYDSTPGIPAYNYGSTGSGGLGEGFVGFSLSPAPGVNLGGIFQFAFGRTETESTIDFTGSGYTNSYSNNSTYMNGTSGTIGILLDSLDKLTGVSSLKGFSIGGYYKFPYHLRGNAVLQNLYEDSLYSPSSQPVSGYIPAEFGIGIAKKFSQSFVAALDVRSQSFSKYWDTFTAAGSLKDALFLGGGIEYLQGRQIGALYQKRIWRAGFYYQRTQFVLPTTSGANMQVDELFATAGVDFSMSASSTISISAQYGLRGLSSDLLLREKIFRLYFSFTMGEGWFYRPEGD